MSLSPDISGADAVPPASSPSLASCAGMERLVRAVQDLSRVRSVEEIREIVRHAARELTGADGATFVLRDGDQCHYVDEDAIAPLWKGQRFPLHTCVSGWAMTNRRPAVIADVFDDVRVPVDAYRPTFVKSLVMVPIRTDDPVGAIGNYWSTPHRATAEEVQVLQALANTTAVAMENVRVYQELEKRVRDRTLQLEHANEELSSFAASVSHDLRAPLAVISGYADLLQLTSAASLDEKARSYLQKIPVHVRRMSALIDDLMRLAKIRTAELSVTSVDLTALARDIARRLEAAHPGHPVRFVAQDLPPVKGDEPLLCIALENLLSNAWKYTQRTNGATVVFGGREESDGTFGYFVRDNGAGFAAEDAGRLFVPFQRLHVAADFPGTGVGLTIVARIIEKHGGRVWADGTPDAGATFHFTLGLPE
ncbi:MAG: GAF domain-containing protein [Candidatus Didemnitutus sp.]|nr:GAF domain-containing protein [Candidatus Didemnitutus sp.]